MDLETCADVAAAWEAARRAENPSLDEKLTGTEGISSDKKPACSVRNASGGQIAFVYRRDNCPSVQWEDVNATERATSAAVPILCGLRVGQKLDSANFGPPCPSCKSNPVHAGTGNKYQYELDYAGFGAWPLRFGRHYNSRAVLDYPLARGPQTQLALGYWSHDYERSVRWGNFSDPAHATAYVRRADGRSYAFTKTAAGAWVSPVRTGGRLDEVLDVNGARTGWTYVGEEAAATERYDANGRLVAIDHHGGGSLVLAYDAAGRLERVTDPTGRSLRLTYDAAARVRLLQDPGGGAITYDYDSAGRLTTVTYQDGSTRRYHYEGAGLPLGGITDERGVRFATFTYDGILRAIASEHAGGVGRVTFAYPTSGTVTSFTDAFGVARGYGYTVSRGTVLPGAFTGPACPECGPAATSYDAGGFVAARIDWNGVRTDYQHDSFRRETSRTEGLTASGGATPQTRSVRTEWHPELRLPMRIAEPLRLTTNAYDPDGSLCGARGALCARTVHATSDGSGSLGFSAAPVGAPRTWTYTYNHNGSVLTADGPRTDVADITSYAYDAQGNLAAVTNALGQVTTFGAHNAHGQPLEIIDPNGVVTVLAYDARQRLASRTIAGETTVYQYDAAGQLVRVTLPDGSFVGYVYDAARRLIGMHDNAGNRIAYTLDASGNRTREDVLDPAGQLAQTRARIYSNLNRLLREFGAHGQATEYGYDAQGNVVSVRDPLGRITATQFDALNRVRQVTDAGGGITRYAYDGQGALIEVSDPRGLVTTYAVDGLGNLLQQSSPDTGITSSTYDAAGNLLAQTDAKGQTTVYSYDALNRVTLIRFHDGARHAYGYDAGAHGIGRLTSIAERSGAGDLTSQIEYAYDARGRVTAETRTIAGVAYSTNYAYDPAGRLVAMTYPSGRTLAYGYDVLGRLAGITTTRDGNLQTVVAQALYHPFGGAKSYVLGNGQAYVRSYDLDGRINAYTLGGAVFGIGYDAAGRIEWIAEAAAPANVNTYLYDALDRLTGAVVPGTAYGYTYDAVGNRTSRSVGAATEALAYSATSNRIATVAPASGPVRNFVFDANGSTVDDGVNVYAYDARGRMVQATTAAGSTTYQVNALGQRVRKTNGDGDTVFHYDQAGRLIAETDAAGAVMREVLYLGDIPVGVVQ
ncbi:MAG TPA: DUF6531 domain-containing protein [Burkholderiales bacterium]|nr:DUF6531 domain-containing protein [Burkholderiales bacterium]